MTATTGCTRGAEKTDAPACRAPDHGLAVQGRTMLRIAHGTAHRYCTHLVLQLVVVLHAPHHRAAGVVRAAHVKLREGGVVGQAVDLLRLHNHACRGGGGGGGGATNPTRGTLLSRGTAWLCKRRSSSQRHACSNNDASEAVQVQAAATWWAAVSTAYAPSQPGLGTPTAPSQSKISA